MTRALALLLAVAGCNDLLGLDGPTLAHDDVPVPSCARGWTHRVPITLVNDAATDLHGYQIMVVLDTHVPITAGKMRADGGDLQFVTASGAGPLPRVIERDLDGATTIVWVRVPVVPIGASTLYAYYGNPTADQVSESPFEYGIFADPSFEGDGPAWTPTVPRGAAATMDVRSDGWASDGTHAFFIDSEVDGYRPGPTQSGIQQTIDVPDDINYVLRLDLYIVADSWGGFQEGDDARFSITRGSGEDEIWKLGGSVNVTGTHIGEETAPLGAGPLDLTITTRINFGHSPAAAKGYVDNLRVRKLASPDPTATTGAEESACGS